ncbi:MAG: hypothetical protein Q7S21_04285 [archaeon]|nr:hypothetical protein [archaeon]
MHDQKNFFPITFPFNDAVRIVDNFVGERGYYSFNIEKTKLVYFPFWFFNFSAFGEGESAKSHKEVAAGSKGFDELGNDFSEKFPEQFRNALLVEFSDMPEADYKIQLKETEYSLLEVREMIQVKLASMFSVQKQNMVISSLKLVYLPKWFITVLVDKKEYVFEVSLIKKEILNPNILVPKIKPVQEQTKEILKEFLQPKAWISVPAEMLKDLLIFLRKGTPTQTAKQKLKGDKRIQYYIVIVVLIILLAYFLWQYLSR